MGGVYSDNCENLNTTNMLQELILCCQGRTGPTKVAGVLNTSRISKSTFLTLNLALNKMQCANHCQSSNKPNTGELNDFALFRYSRVLWSNGHGKAFVRQGEFNSDDLLYFDQCTNFKSSWPFRTVLRFDDKLRVTDILEEYKSKVEEG